MLMASPQTFGAWFMGHIIQSVVNPLSDKTMEMKLESGENDLIIAGVMYKFYAKFGSQVSKFITTSTSFDS